MTKLTKTKRPTPPEELQEEGYSGNFCFEPAKDLSAWIYREFIEPSGRLYREEHHHLGERRVACLWTNVPLRQKGKPLAATAEIPAAQGNKWAQARAKQQLREWFGAEPDFLLTFYAPDSALRDDAEFCALVRHELLHCDRRRDADGYVKFNKDGETTPAIIGHDVEEFVAVVEDFGIDCAAGRAREFVAAANKAPKVARAKIGAACGVCLR